MPELEEDVESMSLSDYVDFMLETKDILEEAA
jgi:hypothetical protein